MSRYINYDELNYRGDKLIGQTNLFMNGVQFMIDRINEAPSIDIVRCKECKHWHKKDDLTYCGRVDYGYGYKPDDFCSYGEREGE